MKQRQSNWHGNTYRVGGRSATYQHFEYGFYVINFCVFLSLSDGSGDLPVKTRKCTTERDARRFCKRWCTDLEWLP